MYRTAIDPDPKDADAHLNLGVLLMKHEDYDGAEEMYRTAIKHEM